MARFPTLVPDIEDLSPPFRDGYQNILDIVHKLCKLKPSFCTHCSHIFHQFDCCLLVLNWFEEIINIGISPKCLLLLYHTFAHDLLMFFTLHSYYNLAMKLPRRCEHSCVSVEVVHWYLHSPTKKNLAVFCVDQAQTLDKGHVQKK